jgi:tetratricopeptide (TPR) repeat protein
MSAATIVSTELSKQNPWPGLRAFGEGDRDYFFGRDREATELFGLVQRASVVVLYGQSGLGKTSLLQAGLFPRLKTLDFFPVRVRFDHGDDAPPLAQQITAAVTDELDRLQIKCPRPGPNETLWEYFHRRDVDFWGPRNRLLTPVLVLDQFEEIFTLGHRSEKSNARVADFQKELESLLEHRPPDAVRERLEANPDDALRFDLKKQSVKFVITLREDFLADLDPWRERMPSLLPNRFRLERMTGQQALEVVQRAGSDVVDPSVARDIVDFVSTSRLKRSSSALEQRDVDPALLSVVCDGLNYSRIARGKPRITADLLTAEREEIMKDFYERTFEGVDPRVRDWVEDRLLTSSGYRDRAALEDAKKLGLPEADFDVLVNRRLLHREERAGVIWLELTHDSLTDPASRSRAVREQRIQADAAKEREKAAADREAQVRRQLRKSQFLGTVFGLVSLIALLAFYFSYREYRQARATEILATTTAQRLEAEHKAMVEAQGRETAKDAELHSAREKNEENFKEQVSAAGALFDMRVPTATVINIIQITDNSFITLSSDHDSQNDIDLPHARFLAQAAEALYQVGHYDEGIKYANRAMDLVTGNVKPGDSQAGLKETRAEVLYARGAGLLAFGNIDEARKCFDQAATLASTSTDPDAKQGMARVFVLSYIGLGEISTDVYQPGEARNHYQTAIKFVKQSGSSADEYSYWQVLALRGLSLTETDDVKAQPFIAQANDVVSKLLAHDPGNIRWKTLLTEISYSQGFTAMRLEQYDAAKNLFEQSEATDEDLHGRDAQNREWHLNLARIQRALGLLHHNQGELVAAEKYLKQSADAAKELNEQQKLWTRATLVRGLTLMALGDVEASEHLQAAEPSNDLGSVFEKYTQARAIFLETRASAPSVILFQDDVAQAAARQGYLRTLQANEAKSKAGKDKQVQDLAAMPRNTEALDFYLQALKALEPLDVVAKDDVSILREKSNLYQSVGNIEVSMNEPAKAIAAYEKAVNWATVVVKMEPSADDYSRFDVAVSSLGDVYEKTHELDKASAEYGLAQDALTKALAIRPNDNELTRKRAVVLSRISDLWYERGDLTKALDELEKAFDSVWKALQSDYSGETLNSNLKFYQDRLTRIRTAVTAKPAATAPQNNLTPEASQALLRRMNDLAGRINTSKLLDRNKQDVNWSLRTIVPGTWRILPTEEAAAPLQHLLAIDKKITSDQVRGIRKMHVDFYDNANLYEAAVKLSDGEEGIISYVQRGPDWVLLTGDSDAILKTLNKSAAPKLDQADLALAYLRFYVNSVDNAYAIRYRMIDHPEDVDWMPSASGDVRSSIDEKFRPLTLEASPDQEWQAKGTLQVANTFKEGIFHLKRNGAVDMTYSQQIEKDWPVFMDTFIDGVRLQRTIGQMVAAKPKKDLADTLATLKVNPKDADALKNLPGFYFATHRWKEAVEAGKVWLAYVKEEPDAVPEKAADLLEANVSLSWDQLLAQDFNGALASSGEAIKLDPKNMRAVADRALALMFLGRTKEAEPIFLAHIGEKMNASSEVTWEDAVVPDIATLRNQDITSPDGERISELVTAKKNQMHMAAYEETLKQNQNDENALRQLPDLYFKANRRTDAVEGEKRLVAFLKSKPDTDPAKINGVRDALDALAWYQLFTRDFAGALTSADEARKLDPDHLFTESQRAHALMLLGRNREAEAIYIGNIGRKMEGTDDQTWEAMVIEEFTSLQNHGVTNSELTRMRELLGEPEYERYLAEYLAALKKDPEDETALHYLPVVFFDLKRYHDAALAEKNRIAHLLRVDKHDAEATQTLTSAYVSLSWYQDLAGEFADGFTSAELALKLDPTDSAATMNRAHALLFLNREKDAEAIYVANVGRKVNGEQLWDEVVLEDLASLESAGFTNPDVARIRMLMSRAGNERLRARYTEDLKANPNDVNALGGIATVYLHLDRPKEAVDAEKNYIAWVQRQPTHDGAWSIRLSAAQGSLAWYEIFIHDYAGSLASSDEAIRLDPKNLGAQTNRAHALLFLGRTKDAEAIYLGHRGEKVFANSDEKWEAAILTDFDDMEKAGITNPEFARIRALLKPPAK